MCKSNGGWVGSLLSELFPGGERYILYFLGCRRQSKPTERAFTISWTCSSRHYLSRLLEVGYTATFYFFFSWPISHIAFKFQLWDIRFGGKGALSIRDMDFYRFVENLHPARWSPLYLLCWSTVRIRILI